MAHTLVPNNYQELTVQWNVLLISIPKIISYFGDSEFSFHSLTSFLELTPDRIYKSKILANLYNQTPFAHMLFILFEAASSPDTFLYTIFEWTKKRGMLRPWIDHIIFSGSYPPLYMRYVDRFLTQEISGY